MSIPESVRDLLATGPLVHLTTIGPDGGPQVTLVWMGVEGDELVCAHMTDRQKLKNVRRDPRVVVSFIGPERNAMGLQEYVVAYGNARITEGGAADLLQRLAHVYIGPDAVFPPASVRDLPGFVLRVKPERFTGLGPWAK